MSSPSTNTDPHARLRDAIVALHKMRTRLEALQRSKTEPIAVIGLGCRFPGGGDGPAAFWSLLRDGVDAMTPVPQDRWDIDAWYDPDPGAAGKMYVREAGFIRDPDRFDARFFGISPPEAAALDPQQRVLLEVAYEALEHAGQVPSALANTATGVFVGVMGNDYSRLQMRSDDPTRIGPYTGTGYAWSFLAGRLSFFLGLQGPSMVVDTACSSSLVALHLACGSLRSGECGLALAGGVNLILAPESNVVMCQLRALAPDGRCKTFDARADGYGRGEGCGVVVLKRLSDALAAGDPILAVIRGSAVNHDGPSGGLTVPNGAAQQKVIREALANGGVQPSQVSYVEAHGTGTPLGDPIELRAAWSVLGKDRPADATLHVGSVKTNIGHLEGAAGVSGLIKAVLALHHKQIPPHLHLQKLNEYIAWDQMPLHIPQQLTPWEVAPGARRICGVSSFGLSGINAHVVLEEAPAAAPQAPAPEQSAELVVLSAKSAAALDAAAARLGEHLDAHPELGLGDVALSLATTRSPLEHRLAIVAKSRERLREALEAAAQGQTPQGVMRSRADGGGVPKVVFVFPGQGGQWQGMGRQLLAEEPVFRASLEASDRAIRAEAGWSLLEQLAVDPAASQLDRIDVVQPALFAIEVALAALWRSWGVEPDVVVGHSMGEVAAAHVAGALTLEDAVAIICRRSRLLRQVSGQGAMALVELSFSEAQAELRGYEDRLSVAVSNGPQATVLSGELAALAEVMATLEARGVFCRRVKVDVASHSPQVDPLRPELCATLAALAPRATAVPMRSTVTAAMVEGPELGAGYWADNLREPVQFSQAVQALLAEDHGVFVEMSPHPVLTPAVEEMRAAAGRRGVAVASQRREQPERSALLEALGALWAHGHAVPWERLFPAGGRRVSLPTYAWQRERHWLDREASERGARPSARRNATSPHPLLGDVLQASVPPYSRFWEVDLDASRIAYLGEHRVRQGAVLPLSVYLEMAMAAAAEAFSAPAPALSSVALIEALGLPDDCPQRLQLVLTPQAGKLVSFTIASARPEEHAFTTHIAGTIDLDPAPGAPPALVELEAVRARCTEELTGARHREECEASGLSYGPSFQGVQRIWRRTSEGLSLVEAPPAVAASASRYRMHPALLDACLQVMHALVRSEGAQPDRVYVPSGVEHFRIVAPPRGELFNHATVRPSRAAGEYEGDVLIRDAEGRLIAEARGVRMQPIEAVAPRNALDASLYEVRWQLLARKALEEPSRAPDRERAPATWLLLADAKGLAQKLAAELEARGHTAVLVYSDRAAEATFVSEGPRRYRLDPAHPRGFRALLDEVFGGSPPHAVVHLWSLDAAPPSEAGLSWIEEAEILGPASALHLVQALAGAGFRAPPRVWLVTRGVQPLGAHAPAVASAPLWGLGRTLVHEHPELRCSMLDLSPDAGGEPAEVDELLSEMLADDREDQVALRGDARAVARLSRLGAKPADTTIRPDGTYLITGGLGGIGLILARWLVDRGARHLVLVGRSGASASARAILDDFESQGVRVLTPPVDIASPQAVEKLVGEIQRTLPPLRGILHGAGVLDDGIALQLDRARLRRVMMPKADGAWNLHCATASAPLDFFVLLSSMASVLGAPGQANYAAANAFLDTLAHYRRARGLPALSMNWGAWAQTGLAGKVSEAQWTARGLDLLTPEQAVRVLDRWLNAESAQIGIFPIDWAMFSRAMPSGAPPLLAELAGRAGEARPSPGGAAKTPLQLRLESATGQAREAILIAHVQAEVAALLGRGEAHAVPPGTGLFEMGMDSLLALELRRRLQAALGRPVPAPVIFNYSTVEALGRHLVGMLDPGHPPGDQVKRASGVEDAELRAEIAQLSEEDAAAELSALTDALLQDEEESFE